LVVLSPLYCFWCQAISGRYKVENMDKIMTFKNGKKKPDISGNNPIYGGNGIIGFTKETNNEDVIVIGRVGAYCGSLFRETKKCWISDNAIAAYSKLDDN
jgi:type I restriction enzyme S subunit